MTSLEVMKRHLGKNEEFDLGDGEKIMIAPLPAEFLPEYMVGQMGLASGRVAEEDIRLMTKCIIESLRVANPKDSVSSDEEYEKTLANFAARYYFKLLEKIGDINTGGITESDMKKMEKIQKIRGNGLQTKVDSGTK